MFGRVLGMSLMNLFWTVAPISFYIILGDGVNRLQHFTKTLTVFIQSTEKKRRVVYRMQNVTIMVAMFAS